ncbi:hypothetical protein PROFUN_11774 [Planoprotostelium fungivorum]|uniref:NAD(P)-binding domain-containing protein n=1 Tax=Planoprotostelium fungivorum TaxID=1890364 RepID=A0A2P6N8K7_9EUKA|nr:hypothetical protein PROFUN_11774 [Planoprotostelium fungivorum]
MSDKNKKETQNESSASGFIKMATTTRESTAVTDQPLILSGLDVQTKMKLNEKDVNAPSGLITVVGSSSGFGVVIVHELIHRMNIQRQLGKQPMALRAVVLGETDTQRITIGTSALYQNVEIVEADVFNRDQISKAIEGSNFVVNVLEPHHIFGYRGLFNMTKSVRRSNRDAAIELVEACKRMSTKPHMIYISKTALTGRGVDPNERKLWWPRFGSNAMFSGWFRYKWEAEEHIRSSGLPYTILRCPPFITGLPYQRPLKVSQTDNIAGVIARADAAKMVVELMINSKKTVGTTLSAIHQGTRLLRGEPPSETVHRPDYDFIFSRLVTDKDAEK